VTGQGIALVACRSHDRHLAGKLVRLSDSSLRVAYCHYAVTRSLPIQPALLAFRTGLLRSPSRLGTCPSELATLGKEQLQDRGLVRLMVSDDRSTVGASPFTDEWLLIRANSVFV